VNSNVQDQKRLLRNLLIPLALVLGREIVTPDSWESQLIQDLLILRSQMRLNLLQVSEAVLETKLAEQVQKSGM
jgi:hypothetical protein